MEIDIKEQTQISDWLTHLVNTKTPNKILFEDDSIILQYEKMVNGCRVIFEVHVKSNLFALPFYYFSIDTDDVAKYGGKYNITLDMIDQAFHWFDNIHLDEVNIDWDVMYSNDNPEKIIKMEVKE